MNRVDVLNISHETFFVILQAAGLAIAIIQTLTSIQEMTLTFVPKIIIIFAAVIFFMPFMMTSIIEFTQGLYDRIVHLG